MISRTRPMPRGKPPRKRNEKRRRRLFEEDFGGREYLALIHSLECAVCGALCEWTVAAHLRSRGAGGKAADIVPLCGTRFGVQGCHEKYDAHDPEVRKHEMRLRSYAKQLWRSFQEQRDTQEEIA